MQPMLSQTVVQVAAILFSLSLTTAINYFTSNKGTYQQNTVELDGENSVASIQLANHTGSEIEGIQILVPDSVSLNDIKSSIPVKISLSKDSYSLGDSQTLNLALIPTYKTVSLIISYETGSDCCQLLNPGQAGVRVVEGDYSTNALWEAFKYALISVAIYALFFLLGAHDSSKRMKNREQELKERISEVKEDFLQAIQEKEKRHQELSVEFQRLGDNSSKETAELKEACKALQAQVLEFKRMSARAKATNLRRLSDYQKELTFWKDTIRKALYLQGADINKLNTLYSIVTEQLQTYATKENNPFSLEEIHHILDITADEKES